MNWKQRTTIGALALTFLVAIGCHDDRLAATARTVYHVGEDGNLYQRVNTYDGTVGHLVWQPWTLVGKPAGLSKLISGPAMACSGVIAALGSDKQVWLAQGSTAHGWVWFALTGVYSNYAPAITCNGQRDNIDVYATGNDNALWHRAYDPPSASWYDWESLGGTLTSGPAVAGETDRVDAFGRDNTNGMSHIYWNKTTLAWSAWEALGGGILGDPAALRYVVSNNPRYRLDVYAQGTDHHLYRKTYQLPAGIFTGSWLGWEVVGGGGCASASPAATFDSGNRVYIRSNDGPCGPGPAHYYESDMDSVSGSYGGWGLIF